MLILMRRLLALALCLGALAGCDSSGDDFVGGDVRGTVRDATTGEPLADATVRFAWERPPEPGQVLVVTAADDEGFFLNLFRAVGTCETRGDLLLRAEAPGYEASDVVVPCLDEAVVGEVDVELSAAG